MSQSAVKAPWDAPLRGPVTRRTKGGTEIDVRVCQVVDSVRVYGGGGAADARQSCQQTAPEGSLIVRGRLDRCPGNGGELSEAANSQE